MNCHWTCEPGWEEHLRDELARVASDAVHEIVQPGWVHGRGFQSSSDSPSIALAQQCLRNATELAAPSISTWARQAGAALIEQLRQHEGPWRLHTFSHYAREDLSGHRRAVLIRTALLDYLRRKQRRLMRSLTDDVTAPWLLDETLVQLAWMEPVRGVLSVCSANDRRKLRRMVSRFPAGHVDVPDHPDAPSRAYRKLAEVQLRLNRSIKPGETCVDLGSSPGSWAWLALAARAEVTAVDRSALRDDLMRHRRLLFVKGDAFKYEPEEPVDWLFSDVIAFPGRIMELLDTWLGNRWCRRFCVTIKFRGQDEYPRLEEIKSLLTRLRAEFCLHRLTHNRNEVTAYGYAAGVAGSENLC